mmetsp:Transcript_2/g.10  ORF Transcript_2/g.10 Transcript_2/m.10 type:complete len:88 (-) Transcript_2:230-493(-)
MCKCTGKEVGRHTHLASFLPSPNLPSNYAFEWRGRGSERRTKRKSLPHPINHPLLHYQNACVPVSFPLFLSPLLIGREGRMDRQAGK